MAAARRRRSAAALTVVPGTAPRHGVDIDEDGLQPGVHASAWTAPQNVDRRRQDLRAGGQVERAQGQLEAAVHEETATACSAPTYVANSSSKAAHSGPVVSQPEASTVDRRAAPPA